LSHCSEITNNSYFQREHIGIERRLRQLPLCLPVQYATTNTGHQLVAPIIFFIVLSERKINLEQRSPPSIFPKNALFLCYRPKSYFLLTDCLLFLPPLALLVAAGLAKVSCCARSVLLCLARAPSGLSIPICSLWLFPIDTRTTCGQWFLAQ
jgi:hypothetical protein